MTASSATPPSHRFVLRDFTLPARLVLSAFMLSVGIGYVSAIVNLHMQEASAGEPVPTPEDVKVSYHGKADVSQMERLLTAPESLPFNGQGSMRAAFTRDRPECTTVGGVEPAITDCAKKKNLDPTDPKVRKDCETTVLENIDGERQALVAWVRAGYPRDGYNAFLLTGEYKNLRVSDQFVKSDHGERYALIQPIFQSRCARCHAAGKDPAASNYPLTTYDEVTEYCRKPAPSGKSLTKLALSTHVHLLAFSMLYGLTGLVLAFSRLPFLFRLILCPLPLIGQVLDISCWWLARLDGPLGEKFALVIPITGGVVALGLVAQILISVFDMYGWLGRFVLVLLFVAGGAGGGFVMERVVKPYLAYEKGRASMPAVEQKISADPNGGPIKVEPSHLEKLLTDEPRTTTKEFNGKGQMSRAFINEKWAKAIERFHKDHPQMTPEEADAALYAEREGERLSLLAWLRAGAPQEGYEKDAFVLPLEVAGHPITPDFHVPEQKVAKIKSILDTRCARCHSIDNPQADWPLTTYDEIKKYLPVLPGEKARAALPPVITPDKPPVITPDKPPVITPDKPPVITPDKPPVITPDKPPVITLDKPPVITPDKPEKKPGAVRLWGMSVTVGESEKPNISGPEKPPVTTPDKPDKKPGAIHFWGMSLPIGGK